MKAYSYCEYAGTGHVNLWHIRRTKKSITDTRALCGAYVSQDLPDPITGFNLRFNTCRNCNHAYMARRLRFLEPGDKT